MGILMVVGATGPIQQGSQASWSYPTGETSRVDYKGIYSYVKTLYDQYKAVAGSAPSIDGLQLTYQRGMGTLTVSTVEDGPVRYELLGNVVSLPIYGHSTFAALTAAQIHDVRTAYEIGDSVAGAAFTGAQATLYLFLTKGVESYPMSAYVLRSSQTASKRSVLTASYVGVNTVVTPPSTSAVNSLIGNLPSGEWLLQAPNVQMYGNKKWQISQEWWWAPAWSTILYGGTGTP